MDHVLKPGLAGKWDQDVLEFIHLGVENRDEKRFNELALKGFEHQYHINKLYREYCKRKNVSPQTVTQWAQIPAVSSFAFRKSLMTSLPAKRAEQIYLNSGIVELRDRNRLYRGKWSVESISTANALLTRLSLFPDVEKMKILLMVPSPKMAPWMEMAIGLEQLRTKFGTSDSRFLISFAGLDIETLICALRQAEMTQEPLALIGATFGFVYFFEACKKEGISFNLPIGSRICDTGGYMGRYAGCSKEEYFRNCREVLGLEENFCINALWICENSTVYFDNVLRNFFSGIKKERCKEMPPWTRTVAVDTLKFLKLPKGRVGLLRHYDLINQEKSFAVQTDNLGFETEEGFEIMGKWNKNIGTTDIDHSVPHPGGRVTTKIIDFMMRRKLSKITDSCS
jgi:anaerobic magnesium-protoporphyrin IX monomethyl ester cyclase